MKPEPLEIGTRVHLKPREGAIVDQLRGGEGEIVGYLTDGDTIIYRVKLLKNDRIRLAVSHGVEVHRSTRKGSK